MSCPFVPLTLLTVGSTLTRRYSTATASARWSLPDLPGRRRREHREGAWRSSAAVSCSLSMPVSPARDTHRVLTVAALGVGARAADQRSFPACGQGAPCESSRRRRGPRPDLRE